MPRQSISLTTVNKNRLDHLAATREVTDNQVVNDAINIYWHMNKLFPDGVIYLGNGDKIIY